MEMQHLHENDLIVGQPIPWNVYDRDGRLLLHSGITIESAHQIEELKERGLFVNKNDWDEQKGISPQEKISPFALLDELNGQMERMYGRISVDNSLPEKTQNIAKAIQQACEIDPDVAIASIFVGEEGRHPVSHPIHVAILCEILARHFGRPPEERLILISAAVTMNISMVNLQAKLHTQKTPLTEEQLAEIHAHPEKAIEILQEKGVTESLWLQAVMQHHERVDGYGYPKRLKGNEISPMARVIAVADTYCALLASRADRPSVQVNAGMRKLFQARGQQLDTNIVDQFIKIFGIYPPGSFVRLANGDLGIVTRRGKTAATPIIYSVAGPWGAPLSVYIKRDCNQEKFAIREVVKKEDSGIKVNRHMLWGYQ